MAGASMKDIKLRIKSVQSTMQITKAMELVASSKLRRAKERAENSRPYFDLLYKSLCDIAAAAGSDAESPFMQKREVKKTCYIVIAGDRGLAGGYNSNIFKMTAAACPDFSAGCFLPIGKKAVEHFKKKEAEILTEEFMQVEDITGDHAAAIADLICREYLAGSFDRVELIYTSFVSMLSQAPVRLTVLPVEPSQLEKKAERQPLTIYEPSPAVLFDNLIPGFVTGMVYGGVCESLASELAARRNAMDAASKNAGEMIEDLSLKYNRARQGAITQELTEIVAGAEAQ
ncbi:MAG: ATP synthase F1 subunit gamma [Clostridia bacterium]|jgi:F-type H+-transporting ATPase subunit gamma|nr:ATP synthase F1 subunit gamma [Clostridia bacterium]